MNVGFRERPETPPYLASDRRAPRAGGDPVRPAGHALGRASRAATPIGAAAGSLRLGSARPSGPSSGPGSAAEPDPAGGRSSGLRSAGMTAVITGASRGLGLALARFLAEQGATLVLTARDAEALAAAGATLSSAATVRAVAGDVSDPDHRAEVADAVGPRLDLLVHNASALGPSPLPRLEHTDPADLRDVLETNLVAPLALTQALLPALRTARGLVVFVSSDAARGGYEGWGAYGASKAALELLASTLAHEEADVASVAVDPGDMRTAMHQAAFPGEDIGDRPLPEVTLPFWAWLLGQRHDDVDGRRFEAQAASWTLPSVGGTTP